VHAAVLPLPAAGIHASRPPPAPWQQGGEALTTLSVEGTGLPQVIDPSVGRMGGVWVGGREGLVGNLLGTSGQVMVWRCW
jgi:hypothetical protein